MSITNVSRILILLLATCSTMFAWQADRISVDGRWTNYWVITCNDGYMHGGNYGPDGPSFSDGNKLCASHGGITVKPTTGGPVIYQVIVGQAAISDLLLSDLVDTGAVSSTGAVQLTNSREPAVWAKTNVGLSPLSRTAPPDAVTLKATGIDLPEPRNFPNWAIASVAVCLLALIVVLLKRKKT